MLPASTAPRRVTQGPRRARVRPADVMTRRIEVLGRRGFTHLPGFDRLPMDQASNWLYDACSCQLSFSHTHQITTCPHTCGIVTTARTLSRRSGRTRVGLCVLIAIDSSARSPRRANVRGYTRIFRTIFCSYSFARRAKLSLCLRKRFSSCPTDQTEGQRQSTRGRHCRPTYVTYGYRALHTATTRFVSPSASSRSDRPDPWPRQCGRGASYVHGIWGGSPTDLDRRTHHICGGEVYGIP